MSPTQNIYFTNVDTADVVSIIYLKHDLYLVTTMHTLNPNVISEKNGQAIRNQNNRSASSSYHKDSQ